MSATVHETLSRISFPITIGLIDSVNEKSSMLFEIMDSGNKLLRELIAISDFSIK